MIIYGKENEVLKAQKRSLAAWINNAIGSTVVDADNLMQMLSTGVILCKLAKCIQKKVIETTGHYGKIECHWKQLKFWERAKRETFFARDNAEMFIRWCKSFGVRDAVLFESDGLVLQAQPRTVVLCLLEVARLASKYGVLLPPPIQLPKQVSTLMDEDASDCSEEDFFITSSISSPTKFQRLDSGCSSEMRSPSPISAYSKTYSPNSSLKKSGIPLRKTDKNVFVVISDRYCNRTPDAKGEAKKSTSRASSPVMRRSASLARTDTISSRMRSNCTLNRSCSSIASCRSLQEKSAKKAADINTYKGKTSTLDRRVLEIVRKCHKDECKIRRLSEGRYSFSGKNVYLRIVRGNNVVVRLGGGWDTLEHFLSTLDCGKISCTRCTLGNLRNDKKPTSHKNLCPYSTL